MFRKIDDIDQLQMYHKTITVEYLLQELVQYPVEVSVFYYRMPWQREGTITGFVRKDALDLTGDGVSTLETLMQQLISRPGFKYDEWKNKHRDRLQQVLTKGELFRLSWVANLSRGARLVSLENEKDKRLVQLFDDLSHYSGKLYYGRYDIKCASIEDLKASRHFTILEFNGAGAEPHHMYGSGNSFWQACKIIVHHWNMLYKIGKYNHQHGVAYPTLKEGISFTRRSNKHFNHLRELDLKMPVFE
jgi:hypothetical protein